MSRPSLYRIAPFALFMAFIGVDEAARFLRDKGLLDFEDLSLLYLYPVKAILVGVLLVLWWRRYDEIELRDLLRPAHTALSVIVGLVVFLLWINMDWAFGSLAPAGFDPGVFDGGVERALMIAVRLAGASIVVPIMEELFWRSFLIRYIVQNDFSKVAVGLFTWPSFLITVVLFGLEHHFILAGMMAGIAFNLLLYRTRSIAQCILCHAVANLALGAYVLQSGQWRFW